VTMRVGEAELVDSRQILPGQWVQAYHAPHLAAGARAGQYLHVRLPDEPEIPLRRAFALNTTDRATGIVTIHFAATSPVPRRLAHLGPGASVEASGPFGRPFEVDPRSRHLLVIAVGAGIAGVRMLVDEAIGDGRQVTVLFGAASVRDVYPSTLLPDEVEYVVATGDGSMGRHGSIEELVVDYEAWADQAFASGPRPLLSALATLAAGRRQRMGVARLGRKRGGGRPVQPGSPQARRKAFLQVSLAQDLVCAAGTCLGCVVMGAGGVPQRVCREGPVLAADEIDWEAPG
jgi:dihydroorotate dehydrogenase electron transfer subunit